MQLLSDLQTRAKASALAASAPLKMPLLVREGWGVIALIIVLGIIPSWLATGWLLSKVLPVLSHLVGVPLKLPLSVFVLLGFFLIATPAFLLVYYVAGRYTCRLTNYYASIGRIEDAETVALGFQATVWYLHLTQDYQFASFLKASNLGEKSDRYAKFLARMK
jgi:hypothetical protein